MKHNFTIIGFIDISIEVKEESYLQIKEWFFYDAFIKDSRTNAINS